MKFLKKVTSLPTPLEEGVLYYNETDGAVALKKAEPTPTVELVDLGLPSGLKWATCNIGATKPEEYGLYFQWGATEGYEYDSAEAKAHSTWSTAPFNNGSSSYNSSYFTANSGTWLTNDAILKSEYDAATQAYGEGYRMPTKEECQELTANTTSTWYAKGNTEFNGVKGRKFTSKTDSSKYIFIPTAGYCYNGSFGDVGSSYVWPSSLYSKYPSSPWYLYFNSSSLGLYNGYHRCGGFSVRAVHE